MRSSEKPRAIKITQRNYHRRTDKESEKENGNRYQIIYLNYGLLGNGRVILSFHFTFY